MGRAEPSQKFFSSSYGYGLDSLLITAYCHFVHLLCLIRMLIVVLIVIQVIGIVNASKDQFIHTFAVHGRARKFGIIEPRPFSRQNTLEAVHKRRRNSFWVF